MWTATTYKIQRQYSHKYQAEVGVFWVLTSPWEYLCSQLKLTIFLIFNLELPISWSPSLEIIDTWWVNSLDKHRHQVPYPTSGPDTGKLFVSSPPKKRLEGCFLNCGWEIILQLEIKIMTYIVPGETAVDLLCIASVLKKEAPSISELVQTPLKSWKHRNTTLSCAQKYFCANCTQIRGSRYNKWRYQPYTIRNA